MLSEFSPPMLRRALALGASMLALSTLAQGQTLLFGASCDGGEAVPPIATTASGSALVTLDTATGDLTLTGTYTGLTTASNNAHIHGSAVSDRGVNAGILVTLTHSGATSGTVSGTAILSPTQVNEMIAGRYYLNIHSVMHVFGEIRGQLDLIPSTDCPAALGTDPVLSDIGGTSFLGPNINDPLEPYGNSLDCSGAAAPGVYAIQIRPVKLAAPISIGLGDFWITGPKLVSFSGVHNQDTVTAGPLMLPNNISFVGLSYGVQGFCGGRLSNALQENIGLP